MPPTITCTGIQMQKFKPYPFQLEAAKLIPRMGGRVLLADEQGCGKGIEAGLVLARNPDYLPCLVVCPPSLRLNWQRELRTKFRIQAEVLTGQTPVCGWRPTLPVTVVGYSTLWHWREELKAAPFQAAILDECHWIKNRKAKRSRAAKMVCQGVPKLIPMSGTPIVNKPIESFTVLNLLRPDLFPSYTAFGNAWCGPVRTQYGVEFKGASNLGELHTLLRQVMIRRLKKDVLPWLPRQTCSLTVLPLTEGGQQEYQEAEDDFLTWLAAIDPDRARRASLAEAICRMTYLRQLAGRHKAPAVADWLKERLRGGKVVCMAFNTEVLDYLEDRFGRRCVRVDGGVSSAKKDAAVRAFQSDPRKELFLGHMDSAGEGLTLTAASTVAMAQLPWSPGKLGQCLARIDRPGQEQANEACLLVAPGTIEEAHASLLVEKQSVLDAVLDGGRRDEDSVPTDVLLELFTRLRGAT
jgi:SWI/SNF-related matrix-associated actin-dependent regulator 1 of chromatin subfamily A